MTLRSYLFWPLFLSGLVLFLSACPSAAEFETVISGTSVVEVSGNPALGQWKYCITVSWDTGTQYALSHLNVALGLPGCTCACDGFSFAAEDTAGHSTGTTTGRACEVDYAATYSCDGDPSIPGLDEPLVKFEPYEVGCDPGVIGTGVFCFYSDWPPVAVTAPNSLLSMKYDGLECFGELMGELPACTGPSATESASWGGVKRLYQ